MARNKETRRGFLKRAGVGVLAAPLGATGFSQDQPKAPDPQAIVAALGDALIPTDEPKYPGYKRLESYGISARVWTLLRRLERVTPADMLAFNDGSKDSTGQSFLDLDAATRSAYVETIWADSGKSQPALYKTLRLSRDRIFTVFYRNFPFDTIDRDDTGTPIASDKEHQIINPKKAAIATGWDIANYRGPLSWEEEQERRNRFKKIHWHEGGSGND